MTTLKSMIPYRIARQLIANDGSETLEIEWCSLDTASHRVKYLRIERQSTIPITLPHFSVKYSDSNNYINIDSLMPIDIMVRVETESIVLLSSAVTDLTENNFYVYFINMYCEKNKVDKKWWDYPDDSGDLKLLKLSSGTLRESSSLINPVVSFEWDSHIAPNFNYVYIPSFNRYFFVNDISFVMNNLWVMRLSVDVLNTYKDNIKSLDAFVDRQENLYDSMIADDKFPLKFERKTTTKTITPTTDIFPTSESRKNFVITTISTQGLQEE